jgi:hypothetical protein
MTNTKQIPHVTYFNRHEHMSAETLSQVSELIHASIDETESMMGVTNSLYGLYDGYLYASLLPDGKKELSPKTYAKLVVVVEIIKLYPSTESDTTQH